MKAQSFSHVGITVRDFNRFVQFYWEVFGCPLVGVADTPPDRVRAFFGIPWNRVGLTHFSLEVRNTRKWYAYLQSKGVELVSPPERSPRGHSFFFARDCDGNLIEMIDLGHMYYVLKFLGPLGGWIFRRGMYKQYYAR
jgi:catechol 2,3-dioxygenase-like lactoylglutathione lyase family enzyme